MAVLKVREETLPWDLTLVIGGKDYPVTRPDSEQREALADLKTDTPMETLRTILRGLLQLANGESISDEQAVAAMMAIAIAMAERGKARQQILTKAIRAECAESDAAA